MHLANLANEPKRANILYVVQFVLELEIWFVR